MIDQLDRLPVFEDNQKRALLYRQEIYDDRCRFVQNIRQPDQNKLPKLSAQDLMFLRSFTGYQNHLSDNLGEWPLIDRENIRNPHFFSSTMDNLAAARKKTSGTSGPPVEVLFAEDFYYINHFNKHFKAAARAGFTACQMSNSEIFSITLTDDTSTQGFRRLDPLNQLGPQIVYAVQPNTLEKNFAAVAEIIQNSSVFLIACKPALLELFVNFLRTSHFCLAGKLMMVITAGSHLPERVRKVASVQLATRIVSSYTTTEFGYLGSEDPSGQMILDCGSHFFESVYDARSDSNNLIVTNLQNSAMPLIRYRIGDTGKLLPTTNGLHLLDFTGRSPVLFETAKKQAFSSSVFMNILIDLPFLADFMLLQTTPNHFRFSTPDGHTLTNRQQGLVEAYMRKHIPDPEWSVDFVTESLLVNGKSSRFRRCF